MSSQSGFLSRNIKYIVYSCKPQFHLKFIKVGFKGGQIYIDMFL